MKSNQHKAIFNHLTFNQWNINQCFESVHRKPTHTAPRFIIHALSLLSTTHWSAVLSAPVTNTAWSRNFITSRHHRNSTDTSISTSISPSQASHQKNEHSSSPPLPSRTSATHHTSYNASSAKLKSRYSTRHQTWFKHHYKRTRTNRTQ